MASLNGIVFLIVGATVSIISISIGSKMKAFIWIGIVMAAYGIFKLVIQYLDSQTSFKKPEKKKHLCPGCGARIHPDFRFCPFCSYRLKP